MGQRGAVVTGEKTYLAALCTADGEPIVNGPDGWEHCNGRATHEPTPRPGSVAGADVWDCDAAAAGRLGPEGPGNQPFAGRDDG